MNYLTSKEIYEVLGNDYVHAGSYDYAAMLDEFRKTFEKGKR